MSFVERTPSPPGTLLNNVFFGRGVDVSIGLETPPT
jgi:hypothetical protein